MRLIPYKVEGSRSWIFDVRSDNWIFNVLQAIIQVDLLEDISIFYWNDLLESCFFCLHFAVVLFAVAALIWQNTVTALPASVIIPHPFPQPNYIQMRLSNSWSTCRSSKSRSVFVHSRELFESTQKEIKLSFVEVLLLLYSSYLISWQFWKQVEV